MKLCKDCKWCDRDPTMPSCKNPKLGTSPVDGEVDCMFCYACRHGRGHKEHVCGLDGNWWEAK